MNKNKSQIIPNRYRLLCLDAGSTMVKAAEYFNGEVRLLTSERSISSVFNEINTYTGYKYDEILITGHKQWQEDFKKFDWPAERRFYFNNGYIPENSLNYKTPSTLGLDRYLGCLGALATLNNEENGIIVVDAGTACTIDMMSRNGTFNGGIIMPGLSTWENSLKQYTPQLPAVERVLPPDYPGKTTETCLQWGMFGSFIAAIEYHRKKLEQKYGSCKTFITGGDGKDLIGPLQLNERRYDKLLVFKGMIEFRKWFINEPFNYE